jgi:hypothetical protein
MQIRGCGKVDLVRFGTFTAGTIKQVVVEIVFNDEWGPELMFPNRGIRAQGKIVSRPRPMKVRGGGMIQVPFIQRVERGKGPVSYFFLALFPQNLELFPFIRTHYVPMMVIEHSRGNRIIRLLHGYGEEMPGARPVANK